MKKRGWRSTTTKSLPRIVLIGVLAALILITVVKFTPIALGSDTPHPVITISVTDLTTGETISNEQTITATDFFQVTVTTNGVNCAGQFVVTALGASGSPPSVLVQSVPFIIGPAVSSNSVSGTQLQATVLSIGFNSWKISASCNGVGINQFAFASFQFFVSV
jgi:hypothetical protein